MINNKKQGSTKEEVRQHLQNDNKRSIVGGASGLGFVGGAGVKAAKGAFQIIKNLLTRGSKPKNIGGFREFADTKLRNHFNPTSKRTTSLPNPIPNSTKAYNKLKYPMGKKAFSQTSKSKPVDFKGPNPAHNIGAGGNSYPQ
jgi:hypothetical protein